MGKFIKKTINIPDAFVSNGKVLSGAVLEISEGFNDLVLLWVLIWQKLLKALKTIFNFLSQGIDENFISFIYLIYLSNLGLFLPLKSSYSNKV